MIRFWLVLICFLAAASFTQAEDWIDIETDSTPLTLSQFIEEGTHKDTEFEAILIDSYILNYEKALRLPADDFVLSVKGQYHLFIEDEKERGEASISLSRLFPMTGTEIEAAYDSTPVSASSRNNADVTFMLTQPIARNAFGKSTRLLDQLIGLEVEVARHQIAEAYEDYLAVIMLEYLKWYESYENLKIGISSYKENLKLLENIKDRQDHKIALPIDVHKVEIQVMEKQESLINYHFIYQSQTNVIKRILRDDSSQAIVPAVPESHLNIENDFNAYYRLFKLQSRTYHVLDLLEERSFIRVQRDADDLLPSIDLLIGYEVEGTDFNLEENDRLFYAGVQMDWPLPDRVERAEHEVSKLNLRKTGYQVQNTHYQLYSQLKNLHDEIRKEMRLDEIAKTKMEAAKAVLRDETENYTFGKVTLNDYIRAVNALDNARFNLVLHEVKIQKLTLEWKRLTDTLIQSDQIPLPSQ